MVTTHASCTRLFLLCTNKAPDASGGVTKVAPSENDTSPMVINVATGRAGVSYGRVRWLMVALSGDYAPTQLPGASFLPSWEHPQRSRKAPTRVQCLVEHDRWCGCLVLVQSGALHQVVHFVVHLTTLHMHQRPPPDQVTWLIRLNIIRTRQRTTVRNSVLA